MKSTKLFIIMLAVVGLCLTGIQFSDAATKACTNCCTNCAQIYDGQVGGNCPSKAAYKAWGTKTSGVYPSGITCRIESLLSFGVCCFLTNCPSNDVMLGWCTAGAMGIYWACENETYEEQEDCQYECRQSYDCSGCGGC